MYHRIRGWFNLDPIRKKHGTLGTRTVGTRRTLRYEPLEDRRMLATLTVNVSNDGTIANNDGDLTLREAIAYVNLDDTPGANDSNHIDTSVDPIGQNDRIFFDSSLDGTPILLTQGELAITESVTIDASSLSNGLTIDAGNGDDNMANTLDGSRIFSINLSDASGSVTLDSLTITGGDVPRPFGILGKGGGVFVDTKGDFNLINSTVTGNAAGSVPFAQLSLAA